MVGHATIHREWQLLLIRIFELLVNAILFELQNLSFKLWLDVCVNWLPKRLFESGFIYDATRSIVILDVLYSTFEGLLIFAHKIKFTKNTCCLLKLVQLGDDGAFVLVVVFNLLGLSLYLLHEGVGCQQWLLVDSF